MNTIMVDTNFVKEMAGKPDWVLVDVRLGEEYSKGHIPGAVKLPGWVSKIFAEDTKRQAIVLSQLEKTLGEMGIDNNSHVIVYGDPANAHWNGVLFWMLEAFGCNTTMEATVQFYDGGVSRWQDEGGTLEQTQPAIQPVEFKAVPGAKRGVEADEMLQLVEGTRNAVVLDTRTPGEYNGTDVRALRGGHIPEAININFIRNLNTTTSRMLEFEELHELYKGVPKDQRVITYCQTGARASYTYLVLRALGYQDVAIYHDGWRVYGSDLKMPVEDETWFDFTKITVMMNTINTLQQKMQ